MASFQIIENIDEQINTLNVKMGTENYYRNIIFSYFFQYHRRNNEPNPQLKLYLKYSCRKKK